MMPYESHTIYGKSHTIARRFLRQVRCLFSDIFYPLAQLGYFLIVVLYLIVQLFNIGTVGVNVSIEIENFFFCTVPLFILQLFIFKFYIGNGLLQLSIAVLELYNLLLQFIDVGQDQATAILYFCFRCDRGHSCHITWIGVDFDDAAGSDPRHIGEHPQRDSPKLLRHRDMHHIEIWG